MIYLTHGSEDSTDLDRVYFFDEKPSFRACQSFCAESEENRNIAVVRGGVVVECFKGLPDEVNNGLLRTSPLHRQEHPSPILRPVTRIIALKVARAARVILTRLTRTSFRHAVKAALNAHDLDALRRGLAAVDFRDAEVDGDALKSIATQLGQSRALARGQELYTKQEIVAAFPDLDPLIYRADSPRQSLQALNSHRDQLLAEIEGVAVDLCGPLNLLRRAPASPARDQAPIDVQSHGLLLDLKAERCLALPVEGVESPLVAYLLDGQPRLALAQGFGALSPGEEAALLESLDAPRLDLARYHHTFCLEGGALRHRGSRHRFTGDPVDPAEFDFIHRSQPLR